MFEPRIVAAGPLRQFLTFARDKFFFEPDCKPESSFSTGNFLTAFQLELARS